MSFHRRISISLVLSFLAFPASAQDEGREPIAFAGGELTITETADYEKILAFDGRELARDYFVFFDKVAQVAGSDVAFVFVGPGGNACAPSVVMVWRPEGGDVMAETTPADCATPSPAISDSEVFFVPYLLPGETADITTWAPGEGFSLHGKLAYAPQPETSWETFDPASVGYPMEFFRNAGIYAASEAALGDELSDVALGLGTSSQPDITPEGLVWARGCVPHACGVSDTLMVVDPAARAVYFAQQDDQVRFWPDRASWPANVSALIPFDF